MLSRILARPARPRPSSCWKLTNSFTSPLLSRRCKHQILAALGLSVHPVVLLVVRDAQKTVLVVVGGTLTIGEGGGDQIHTGFCHVLELVTMRMDSLLGHAALDPVQHRSGRWQAVWRHCDRVRSFSISRRCAGSGWQLLLEHVVPRSAAGQNALAEIAHQQAGGPRRG